MANVRLTIVLISAALYVLMLATVPLRLRYIKKRIGTMVLPTTPKKPFLDILILIFSALLILFLLTRDVGTPGTIAICLVAILGAAMGSEELSLLKKCGVYTNGVLFGGNHIPLNEIYALKVFYDEKNDETANEKNNSVLKILTNRRGTLTLIYASEKECRAVVRTLKELSPEIRM